MKNENDAVDFLRLHPVKRKRSTKNKNPILFVRQDSGIKGFLPISIRMIHPIQSPVERNKNLAIEGNRKINNEIICSTRSFL